jgi:hypothetical protein
MFIIKTHFVLIVYRGNHGYERMKGTRLGFSKVNYEITVRYEENSFWKYTI